MGGMVNYPGAVRAISGGGVDFVGNGRRSVRGTSR